MQNIELPDGGDFVFHPFRGVCAKKVIAEQEPR